ncbi:MAG: hypothetical protein M0024_01680 [Nitrospiraceae bacterium]|nr:hypothetical protein [Nitrospiraceae bacterium]
MSTRLDRVVVYSGYRGEESPRAFFISDEKITVAEIIGMWVDESVHDRSRKRFFRIKGSDDKIYTLCHDPETSEWSFER